VRPLFVNPSYGKGLIVDLRIFKIADNSRAYQLTPAHSKRQSYYCNNHGTNRSAICQELGIEGNVEKS